MAEGLLVLRREEHNLMRSDTGCDVIFGVFRCEDG